MKTWTLEDARNRFGDLARQALAREPQRIALGEGESVVMVNSDDFAAMRFASDLVDFIRRKVTPGDLAAVKRPPPHDMAIDDATRMEDQ